MFISSAFLRTFDTVLRDTLQLSTMFLSLKLRLCNLIISRYLVMVLTLLIMYLHQSVHNYSIRNLCNGFHKSGMLISLHRNRGFLITGMIVPTTGTVALLYRNGGSQSPDRWLKRSRNTHYFPSALNSIPLTSFSAWKNAENHTLYTDKLRISVLTLSRIDLVTQRAIVSGFTIQHLLSLQYSPILICLFFHSSQFV